MAVLLGVLVAASFGSGDFLGGRASRRAPTLTVLMVAQGAAVLGAVIVSAFVSGHVTGHDLAFGALAGSVNIVGIGLLYQGLAVGAMGVVAPVTAVVAAVVPVAWGVANGERPSAIVVIGVVFAFVACALISRDSSEHEATTPRVSGVIWAVSAGAFLGTSLVFYVQTSTASGLWPVLSARVVAFVLVAIVLLVLARRGPAQPFPTGPDRTLASAPASSTSPRRRCCSSRSGADSSRSSRPSPRSGPRQPSCSPASCSASVCTRCNESGLLFALVGLVMIVAG